MPSSWNSGEYLVYNFTFTLSWLLTVILYCLQRWDVNNSAVLTAYPTQNAIQSGVFFAIDYNGERGKASSSVSRMQENGKTFDDQPWVGRNRRVWRKKSANFISPTFSGATVNWFKSCARSMRKWQLVFTSRI